MTRVSASVAAVLFAGICLWSIRDYRPPLPNPIEFEMVPGPRATEAGQPLIVAGSVEKGDFLFLRFTDPETAVFGYDHWGRPGTWSSPVKMEAGSPHRLSVEMPALSDREDSYGPISPRLRIVCDGREVLSRDVLFYPRPADRIFFGENPLGGISCGRDFAGDLTWAGGRPLRGSIDTILTSFDRARGWLRSRFSAEALGLSVLLGCAAGWCARSRRQLAGGFAATARLAAAHRCFLLAVLAACVVFAWLVTDGTFRFLYPEVFGQFYDYQAQSLLHGRFDVPDGALGGEAFVFQGRVYGYFGIMPALLRMPFVILGVGFGQLSRLFMMGYFIAALAGAYAILLHLTLLGRPRAKGPSAGATLLLVLNVGLGSTLLFLASRAYIYHEAILSGAAFALWAAYFSLRYLQAPGWRWAAWALGTGLCSAQSRPSVGLFALALVGAAALVAGWNAPMPLKLRQHLPVAGLSVLLFLTVNLVGYFRFHTFEPAPFRYHVQYSAFPARLAQFKGKNFHIENIRMNSAAYLFSFYGTFRRNFPYLTISYRNPGDFPGTLYDNAEPVLAMPFSMTALALLTVVGVVGGVLRAPWLHKPVWILLIAAAPLFIVMLMATASAHRYTADFVPALALGSAIGLALIDTAPRGRWAKGLLAGPTAWAILVTVVLALHYQGAEVWGVPPEGIQHYQKIARWFDGRFGRHD